MGKSEGFWKRKKNLKTVPVRIFGFVDGDNRSSLEKTKMSKSKNNGEGPASAPH